MANFNIDYLVVAGGGAGGGYYRGGGGGAGELKESASSIALSTGSPYAVVVGAGGAGVIVSSDNGSNGNNGDNSTFYNITSLGGGGGSPGDGSSGNTGSNGGSGGGAGGNWGGTSANGGSANGTGLGNNGGYGGPGSSAWQCGGGGGGATQVGFNAGTSGTDGDGGAGKTYTAATSITGQAFSIAGGGGGANYSSGNITVGGIGGGAAGASGTSPYTSGPSGTNNTGGGGGGGNGASPQGAGGDGGSGIVILRYATADANYTTTGSTPTEDTTTIPGQTILSFTTVGTGSITFTTPLPQPFSGTKVTTPVTDFNKPNTEEGLKIPSGTSSEQPTGVDGMVRNDTTQSSKGSVSAITYYNGTDWRYFENELNTNFNTVLYTGDGSANGQSITGVGFQPDLVWIKSMVTLSNGTGGSHMLTDSLRGVDKWLRTNTIDANLTSNSLNSFDSDGFTTDNNYIYNNQSGRDYVAWCFKAGGLINKAADFNGSSSYIQTSLSLNAASNSISFWFNADSVGGQNNCLYFNNRGGRIDININGIGSNTPSASAESILINSTTAITGWNFVSIVFTGWASSYSAGSYGSAITANVYLNGGAAVSLNPTPYGQSDGLRIGRSGGSYYYDGLIGQVRVFTSALSASQVTELYNETAADNNVLNYPTSAGCVAAYPLGENANGVDGLYNGSSSNVTFGKPGYLTRNTEGTIESTVSVNNDLGFSIVKYSGGNSSGTTVGHGLSSAPELIITKNTSKSSSWPVFVTGGIPMGSSTFTLQGSSQYLALNSTTNFIGYSFDSQFGGTANSGSSSQDIISYCFTSKPNYSKIGSFIGTNQPGNKQTTGFEPAFVMIKRTSTTGSWTIIDNKRTPLNKYLSANSNAAEASATSPIVFEDDGFSFGGTGVSFNQSGETAIYLAFANTI